MAIKFALLLSILDGVSLKREAIDKRVGLLTLLQFSCKFLFDAIVDDLIMPLFDLYMINWSVNVLQS